MTPAAEPRAASIPAEVLAFAARQGAAEFVSAVLKMTERLFPEARRIGWSLEADPEIPNDFHILIAVEVPSLDAEQYAEAKFRWSRELFKICPAPLVCIFRCSLRHEMSKSLRCS
jgi:hypothetical protein